MANWEIRKEESMCAAMYRLRQMPKRTQAIFSGAVLAQVHVSLHTSNLQWLYTLVQILIMTTLLTLDLVQVGTMVSIVTLDRTPRPTTVVMPIPTTQS